MLSCFYIKEKLNITELKVTSPTGPQNLDLELVTEDSLPKRQYHPTHVSDNPHVDDWFSCGLILYPTFLTLVVLIYTCFSH